MSYAAEAEKLLTQIPECQVYGNLDKPCEPGCIHEQVQIQQAAVYAQLEISMHLDTIAAHLTR